MASPTPLTLADVQEAQKAQLAAWREFSQTLFDATEKLINLNLAAAKAALEDATQSGHQLLSAKDPQGLADLAADASQPAVEKLVGYSRHAYGIASGAQAQLNRIAEAQLSEGNRRLAEFVDRSMRDAPAGSEPVVALFKSALAAANTAFDATNKVLRQATEWAESNFATATSATLQASAAANDSIKPKIRKVA